MTDWKETLLKTNHKLVDAIKALEGIGERNLYGIVLVVDSSNKLKGTITDGDIRRALIEHGDMSVSLNKVMLKNPVTATLDESEDVIRKRIINNDSLPLPILSDKGEVVDIKAIDDVKKPRLDKRSNPVVLMAGGFGKRLRPQTYTTPKPLLKVGEKTILENILDRFIVSGFHEFYISTHYKAKMIKEHFGNGEKWGVSIKYLFEKQPMGTAGGISLLKNNRFEEPIIVSNGDLITGINFSSLLDFHEKEDVIATMSIRPYKHKVPFGVVKIKEGFLNQVVEKPEQKFFVNAGIYVLEPSIIQYIEPNKYLDMTDLLESRISNGDKVNIFPIHEYWIDIGEKEQFNQAKTDITNKTI